MTGRSLVAKTTLLILAISTLSIAVHAVLLVTWLLPLRQEMTALVSGQVGAVARALAVVPDAERERFAAGLASVGLGLATEPPSAVDTALVSRLPGGMVEDLRQRLGHDVVLTLGTLPDGKLAPYVGFRAGGEAWWLRLAPAASPVAAAATPLVATLVVLGVAVATALVLGLRIITRPMTRLADDMLIRRHELHEVPIPPRASLEVRRVAESFNAVVRDLRDVEASRRLLLAGVSHDLRTPLARLRLRCEVECDDATFRSLEADFDALNRIVGQFFAFAQGEAAGAPGTPVPVAPLLRETAGLYRHAGHPVEATVSDEGTAAAVLPDASVQRILVNLIDNALVHGRGEVQVTLDDTASSIRIEVLDHGGGLAAHDFERALRPFVRLADREEADGHCGLGLAIVAQIAGRLGGKVYRVPFDGRRSGVGVLVPTLDIP